MTELEPGETSLRRIQAHFSQLWQALTQNGDEARDSGETKLLIDRVRAALDQGRDRLLAEQPEYIANTFIVETLIHDGSRTQILRVRHRDLQTLFALRTVQPQEAGLASELLRHEARRHLALRHPNVLPAYMLLRLADGRPALVLEWMEGGSLAQWLAGDDQIASADLTGFMTGLLSGLEAIHRAGLIHMDITPSNLLFADQSLQNVRIADFETALGTNDDWDTLIRTRSEFTAPECLDGSRPDVRSDLYACGRVLDLLLPRCMGEPANTIAELARILADRNPDRRPHSAREALDAIGSTEAL